MAYYGIKQSKVLVPYFLLDKENVTGNKNRVLTDEQKDEFAKLELSLNKVMHEQKPFLDEELTLNKLASIMDVTDKKLSTLLNQHIDTAFYKFVNNFRLEEFKRRIQSNSYKDLTIEGIASDCGFKSKASFYRLFKKETAQSPSEFKSNLK
jgi:transcriptional regulator GlxA family with amidase domain